MEIIEKALHDGLTTLSEFQSKQILSVYGIPVTTEVAIDSIEALDVAIERIGYPLVLKGCSAQIAHKTEKGLIALDIRTREEAEAACQAMIAKMDDPTAQVLVQEMIKGQRELVVGMTRDPQFGPCVMFGLGGIFTEILRDVAFRVAPLTRYDAMELMQDIKGKKILEAVRGMAAVDREVLADILIAVGRIGLENESIQEIDINPLKIRGNQPVAVDALVVLQPKA
jgi:acetate---CoA ligase (ADP-forming) subunit beta